MDLLEYFISGESRGFAVASQVFGMSRNRPEESEAHVKPSLYMFTAIFSPCPKQKGQNESNKVSIMLKSTLVSLLFLLVSSERDAFWYEGLSCSKCLKFLQCSEFCP